MRESQLQRKIQRFIRHELGHWCHKNHGNSFSVPGLPDLTVAMPPKFSGYNIEDQVALWKFTTHRHIPCRTVWLEVKLPGKKPSAVQQACHEKMRHHGMEVHVVHSVEETKEVLVGKEHRAAKA